MEPIFAAQANRLTALSTLGRAGRSARAREWPEALKPVVRTQRTNSEAPHNQERFHGELAAHPEPVSAPGWEGHRFPLRVDGELVQVVTGRLVGPDGQPAALSVGEALTVYGYRLGHRELAVTRIERKNHHTLPEAAPGVVTLGPLAVGIDPYGLASAPSAARASSPA